MDNTFIAAKQTTMNHVMGNFDTWIYDGPSALAAPNIDPTIMAFRMELFAAIRDSFYYAPPPDDEIANFNTRRSRRHKWVLANRHREQARDWIREGSMSADENGHGFGFLWESMKSLGTVHHTLDGFTSNMEILWKKSDKNPKIGLRIITLMKGLIDRTDELGIVADPEEEIKEMKGDQ